MYYWEDTEVSSGKEKTMKQKEEMLEDRSGIRVKYCFDVRKL